MSSPDLTELRAGLLAFLEEGPQVVEDLARTLSAPRSLVIAELHALRTAEAVRNLRFGVWALAGYEPAPKPQKNAAVLVRHDLPIRKHEIDTCTGCGLRYAQEHGLCRRCSRQQGVYTLSTLEAERELVARRQAELAALQTRAMRPPAVRVETIGGVEFEVFSIGGSEMLPPRDGGSSLIGSPLVGKRRQARLRA